MTGQGAAQFQGDDLFISVEVRTVNSRYFKMVLRSSEGYASLEPRIEELVRKQVRRGTVQMDVRIDHASQNDDYQLNESLLTSYFQQLNSVSESLRLGKAIQLENLLLLPGVVEETRGKSVDTDEDWPAIRDTTRQALENLCQMRQDEGQAMGADLAENCRAIRQQLEKVEERAPCVVQQYRERLTDRVNKLLAEFDVRLGPEDVIREVALFAERSDVAEEVVRLRSHLDQFAEIMDLPESSGRKLEFVTQEMFREANTIGSKSNDSEIAKSVVDIKAAIERIREMIQNIE